MFASTLARLRAEKHVSAQCFAVMAGTSQPTVSQYEAGKKFPRIDTAERLVQTLGKTLVAVNQNPAPLHVDAIPIERIAESRTDRDSAIALAHENLLMLVDLDVALLGLDLSFGAIKTYVDGISVDQGSPIDTYQLEEIVVSIRAALRNALSINVQEPLQIIAQDTVIQQHMHLPPVHSELEFLIRGISYGGDPIQVRHIVNSRLLALGYPWLYVQMADITDHLTGVAACRSLKRGTILSDSLSVLQHHD